MSLSRTQNAMRTAIADLIDPLLSRKEEALVWDYFQNSCAYCGKHLNRESRYGHIDHLVSQAKSGSNALGNCVLVCKECNSNEKRDQAWARFLKSKCEDNVTFRARRERILV